VGHQILYLNVGSFKLLYTMEVGLKTTICADLEIMRFHLLIVEDGH
jgi:hypothetical protein